MAAGMRDVAERAGVSIATVSNVLNRPQIVSPGTQDRVRQAIGELGFVRNASARQLRAGTSELICLVVPGFGPFFDELTQGVEARAAEKGLVLFVCATSDSPQKEEGYLRVLMEQRVRGILLTRQSKVFQDPQLTIRRHVPVILVDLESPLHDHCSTAVDDYEGGRLAVQHLYDLGHRRIAWVGPVKVPQMATRANGVRDTAKRLGMEVVEVATEMRAIPPVGQKVAMELHEVGLPSAVICANDAMAMGMELQLLSLGYSIPGDVSIVGYDDIEFAASAIVPLTTIARHPALMGSRAVDLLLAGCGVDEEHRHEQLLFPSELVVRDSTGPAPTG